MNDRPIELFCPDCGYELSIVEANPGRYGKSREETVNVMRIFQATDHPWICIKCKNDNNKSVPLEVR